MHAYCCVEEAATGQHDMLQPSKHELCMRLHAQNILQLHLYREGSISQIIARFGLDLV